MTLELVITMLENVEKKFRVAKKNPVVPTHQHLVPSQPYDQDSLERFPFDTRRPPPLATSRPSSRALSDAVTDPYSQPGSNDALRQRVAANRFEWTCNPDLQTKFSDSEFSDNSVASTDAFVRTAPFRYGNAAARGRRLDEMNRALDGGQCRYNSDKDDIVHDRRYHVSLGNDGSSDRDIHNVNENFKRDNSPFGNQNFSTDSKPNDVFRNNPTSSYNSGFNSDDGSVTLDTKSNGAPSFSRGAGRGLRFRASPLIPGAQNYAAGRTIEETDHERYEVAKSDSEQSVDDKHFKDAENDEHCQGKNRRPPTLHEDRALSSRTDSVCDTLLDETDEETNQRPAQPFSSSVSYSLNTDIRNAQDVKESHPGVAFFHDAASDSSCAAGRHGGRRFVASAHKRYQVVGETPSDEASSGQEQGKRRDALDSLMVQLTSKAKRKDEKGREYYIRDEIIPFDEDRCHEFKGEENRETSE